LGVLGGFAYNEVPFIYLSIKLSGGTLTFSYSFDGVMWQAMTNTLALATFPGAVTHVGMFFGVYGSTYNHTGVVDWFRRVS
jgi:beta-xylosidase